MTESTKVNLPEIKSILEYIEVNPEQWEQGSWAKRESRTSSCGTTFCVAGHAANRAGAEIIYADDGWANSCVTADGTTRTIEFYAQELLGLDAEQAEQLFSGANSLERMWRLVAQWEEKED